MKKIINTFLIIVELTLSGKAQNYNVEIFKNPLDTIPKIFAKGTVSIQES